MRKNNKEFQQKKQIILYLYGFACQLCGLVNTSNHVHHIDKNGNNHNAFNLIPLCGFCHKLVHKNYSFAVHDPPLSLRKSLQELELYY